MARSSRETGALVAGLCALLCACAGPRRHPDAAGLEAAAAAGRRIEARMDDAGLTVSVRFKIKGRDAFASGSLEPARRAASAAITFTPDAQVMWGRLGKKITVLGPAAWASLTHRIAARLVPAGGRSGVLIVAADREMLALRQVDGTPDIIPLTSRPRGLRISRRMDIADLLPEAMRALGHKRPVLISTGSEPAFILLDPIGGRLTSLHLPAPDPAVASLLARTPETTIRGILSLIIRSGAGSLVKNPVSSTLHGVGNALNGVSSLLQGLLRRHPPSPPPPLSGAKPMDSAAFEKKLDATTGRSLTRAAVDFQIGGAAFFPEFIKAIQEARRSIDIQLYIWDNDDYSVQIADLLKKKSLEVPVRIMIDEAASLNSALGDPASPQRRSHAPASMVDYLRAGTNIRVHPAGMTGLTATHTKRIVIDGEQAWTGGMNLGREYRYDWHDMMIHLRGPVVAIMQRDYDRAWAFTSLAGDAAWAVTALRQLSHPLPTVKGKPASGEILVRPLYGGAPSSDIGEARLTAAACAQSRIWLENAYLADSGFIAALIRARYRGVDVRVIIPGESDSPLMTSAVKAHARILMEHGVRVFQLPGMTHVKAAIFDGWACAGSANFDRISLWVNREFDLGFSDPATVEKLARDLFLRDMARSQELTPQNYPAKLSDGFMKAVAGQL